MDMAKAVTDKLNELTVEDLAVEMTDVMDEAHVKADMMT